MSFINKLFEKKISASGLAVFRITFFLNLLLEVIHIFRYRHLYFDKIAYLEFSDINMTLPLLLWMLVLFLIVIGFFTRIATIINYVFCVTILSSFTDFEYHMHYVYVGISFLSIILPFSRSLSLDFLFKPKSQNVSVIYYYLPVFIGIGFVYFDSIFHKFTSEIWTNGLGVWFPSSLPQITIWEDQWLLNQKFLMLFLGYLVLVFETIFIFFFFIKKLRIPFFIIGIGLHIGILLEYPIPYFALGVIAIYLLLVPVAYWDKLFSRMGLNGKYLAKKNEEVPFQSPKKKLIAIIIFLLIFLQTNITLQSPLLKPVISKVTKNIGVERHFNNTSDQLSHFSRKFFGITKHPVFMDDHFNGYNHIISVSFIDTLGNSSYLPIINKKGMPNDYLKGALWVNWNWRVNNPKVKDVKLEQGIASYTAYWAKKNNVDLNNARFEISVKKIDLPNWKWEKDYLTKQLNKPWQKAGNILWENKKFKLTLLKPIEDY